jgi:small-conductance mechanosensitive channel
MRHQQAWAPWDAPTEPLLPPHGRGRWRWVIVAGGGFLCVVSWVLTHDTAAGVGLSLRSWLTLALAALVVVLLSAYRAAGLRLLLRAVAEYTVVAVLAALLATTTAGRGPQPARQPSKAKANAAAELCPTLVQAFAGGICDRLDQAWQQAKRTGDQQAPTRRSR